MNQSPENRSLQTISKQHRMTLKLALAGVLIAVGVAASPFHIPVGVSKCFPVQHLINVIAAVLLGPGYAVGMAFSTSLIRNLLGTGSLLAFPGSMIGALLAALFYRLFKRDLAACLGELIGTGVLGAMLAYPIARLIMDNSQAALFTFVIPFGISSLGGAVIAAVILYALKKTGVLKRYSAYLV